MEKKIECTEKKMWGAAAVKGEQKKDEIRDKHKNSQKTRKRRKRNSRKNEKILRVN